ncbi:MAG: DNRLRE domain-containing protein [Bacteroidales bacterium]|nr:DNRLRE domain-containing protein [Bacteroidales bacterium]
MKKITLLALIMTFVSASNLFSQASKFMQPDPTIGIDAIIKSSNPYTNFGNVDELVMNSSNTGTIRSLIKFADINTIPANAQIESAVLYLYGYGSSTVTPNGNSWPNNGLSNELWIERITQPWSESTVQWLNQPTTTTLNRVNVTPSTSILNWNYSDNSNNLLQMVKYMHANPTQNNGFMIKLQNETSPRNTFFKSSDFSEEKFRPTLIVFYSTADFSYTYLASNMYAYSFSSQYFCSSQWSHEWTIDGVVVSTNMNFNYTFPYSSTYTICHKITHIYDGREFTKCETICIE